jgi:3,4-dihydroxy 2-butanone 4-phosphate synthase/GTP cyclohydrolase II
MSDSLQSTFDVKPAIAALRRGEPVIVVDSADRENEGDLVISAEMVTPGVVNFMATHGRGLICAPMLTERLDALRIPPMVARNSDPHGTAFHVGVDHVKCATGISARDRAETIRALARPDSVAADFSQPGHVFPLAYREGGVLRRAGHTEASVDLCRLAGLGPTALICEIAQADGEMARLSSLIDFGRGHGLVMTTIGDLIAHRRQSEKLVERVSEARIPLKYGEFTAIGYRDLVDGTEHLALVMGDVRDRPGVLVRMHSECLTGDVFRSRRCDCGPQLDLALELIARQGCGAVVYLRGHEGRGIGLLNRLHAYRLQDEGADTVQANLELGYPEDRRDYGTGMQILSELGIHELRLLTNNPAKRAGLEGFGLKVVERVPLITDPTPENIRYLNAKRQKPGHLLDQPRAAQAAGTSSGHR